MPGDTSMPQVPAGKGLRSLLGQRATMMAGPGGRPQRPMGRRYRPSRRLARFWFRTGSGGAMDSAHEASEVLAEAEIAVTCLLATIVAAIAEDVHVDDLRALSRTANLERAHLYLLWDELDRLEASSLPESALVDSWKDLRAEAAHSRARALATEARVPRGVRPNETPESNAVRVPRQARRRGARE